MTGSRHRFNMLMGQLPMLAYREREAELIMKTDLYVGLGYNVLGVGLCLAVAPIVYAQWGVLALGIPCASAAMFAWYGYEAASHAVLARRKREEARALTRAVEAELEDTDWPDDCWLNEEGEA